MKKTFLPKRIPAIAGLILLVILLILGVFLINKSRSVNTSASPQSSPQQVKISNITGNSFVVSWLTPEKTTGLVSVGETSKAGDLKKDSRDQDKTTLVVSKTHYVFVDNLKAQTKYYFKIISGGKTYDNSGGTFEVTTATQKVPTDHDIATGRILNPDNQPATGAIVYLSLANTISQAAITDENGNWMIPLSTARNTNLTDFSAYDRQAQIEEVLVKGEDGTATATLTTGNDNPTPDILLGQNYNFLNQLPNPTQSAGSQPLTTPEQSSTFNPPSVSVENNRELKITFPSEGEQVNSPLPEFFGEGPIGQRLTIEIQSSQTTTSSTQVDQRGKWQWSAKSSLSSGAHQITVSYTNSSGELVKISRSFTVLAAGESELPSFTATPSGQTVTPTVTLQPMAVPTASYAQPTAQPTTLPTAASAGPTEIVGTTPTEALEIPATGISLPTNWLIGAGAITLITGLALLLF